jgi:hypothetical protein
MTAFLKSSALLICGLMLAGCQTTQQTAIALNDSWIGQSADRFFTRNGGPYDRFKLANGGTIYNWRGGERDITITETIREEDPFEDPFPEYRRPLRPRYRFDENGDPQRVFPTRAFPEFRNERTVSRQETVVCEADIATDRRNRIVNITIRKDTRGVGVNSRCAEIFPDS